MPFLFWGHPQENDTAKTSAETDNAADNNAESSEKDEKRRASATAIHLIPASQIQLMEDITDLKWKLHGKNAYFYLYHDAVVKIQAFVRGCLCRGKMEFIIDTMINDILQYRQLMAQYDNESNDTNKQRGNGSTAYVVDENVDNAIIQKSRKMSRLLEENKPWKQNIEDDDDYMPSNTPIDIKLKARLKAWEETNDHTRRERRRQRRANQLTGQCDGSISTTSSATSSSTYYPPVSVAKMFAKYSNDAADDFEEGDETIKAIEQEDQQEGECSFNENNDAAEDENRSMQAQTPPTAHKDNDVDDDANNNDEGVEPSIIDYYPTAFSKEMMEEPTSTSSRGYQRYRTNAINKNKRRPWRDDTNVFDAY